MRILYIAIMFLFAASMFGQQIPPYYIKADVPDGYVFVVYDSTATLVPQDSLTAASPVTVDSFSYSSDTLYLKLSSDPTIYKAEIISGTDDQNLDVGSFNISNGELTIGIEDGTDQVIDLDGRYLTGEVDGSVTNELQTVDYFDISSNELGISLSSDGVPTSTVSLLPYLDNTDDQNLSLDPKSGTDVVLNIQDGADVTLREGSNITLNRAASNLLEISATGDGTGTDDQILTLSGDTLYIENGNNVVLDDYLDNTDGQTLNFSNISRDLSITNGNTVNIPFAPPQTLTYSGDTLYISDGNFVEITSGGGTDDQVIDTFELSGTDLRLSIESDGEPFKVVDLSSLQDGTGTDDQTLTFVSPNLSIESGNSVDLSALQDGTGTDDQNLTGGSFNISNGELTVGIESGSSDVIDLDGRYLTGEVDGSVTNELQTISYNATLDQITLSDGGGTIDITEVNTERTDEEIEDVAGAMFSGNTETLITATYQDFDGTIDLVVEDDLSLYDNTTSGFLTSEVDGSITNEGSLTVAAGTSTTSIINSNTSGSTGVTITAGTNMSISESGNVITLSATGDGTGTDDQNISFGTKAGTDVPLSIESGNEIEFREGSNITLNRIASNLLEISATGGGGGGGDVYKTGTPSNNQHAVWVNDSTIEGSSVLTDDGTNITVSGSIGSNGQAPLGGYSFAGNGPARVYNGSNFAQLHGSPRLELSNSGNVAMYINEGTKMSQRWLGSNIIQFDATDISFLQDLRAYERGTFNNGATAPLTTYGLQAYADANTMSEYSFGAFPDSGPVSFAVTGADRVKGTWADEHNSVTNNGLVPRTWLMPGFEGDPHENNIFYNAHERFVVTATNTTNTNYRNWFENRYPVGGTNIIGDSTSVISIDIQSMGGFSSAGLVYPQGHIYIVTYTGSTIGAATGRMRANDNVWTSLTWEGAVMTPSDNWAGDESMNAYIYRFDVPGTDNNIVEFELTLPNAQSSACLVTSIEYYPTRPEGAQTPFVSKYSDQRMTNALDFYDDTGTEQVSIDPNSTYDLDVSGGLRLTGPFFDVNSNTLNSYMTVFGDTGTVNRLLARPWHDGNNGTKIVDDGSNLQNINAASWTDITDLNTQDKTWGDLTYTFSSSNTTIPVTGEYEVSVSLTLVSSSASDEVVAFAVFANGSQSSQTYITTIPAGEYQTISFTETLSLTGSNVIDIRSDGDGAGTVNLFNNGNCVEIKMIDR